MLHSTFSLTLPGSVRCNFDIVAEENFRMEFVPAEQSRSGEAYHRRIHWWDGAAFLRSVDQLKTRDSDAYHFTLDDVAGMEGLAFIREVEAKAFSSWVHQTVTEAKAARASRKEAQSQ